MNKATAGSVCSVAVVDVAMTTPQEAQGEPFEGKSNMDKALGSRQLWASLGPLQLWVSLGLAIALTSFIALRALWHAPPQSLLDVASPLRLPFSYSGERGPLGTVAAAPAIAGTTVASNQDSIGNSEGTSDEVQIISHSSCQSPGLPVWPPLKVFMYNMPEKFNIGLLQLHNKLRNDSFGSNYTKRCGYPGEHTAEFCLYEDLVRPVSKEASPCLPAAVRVHDPHQADVFYVPFFSSLSYRMIYYTDDESVIAQDERLQVEFMAWLKKQYWWQRHQGWDHVIPKQHPGALRYSKEFVKNAMLLVVDFNGTQPGEPTFEKDIVCPYRHPIPFLDDHDEGLRQNRTTLLFFRGSRFRRGEKAMLRDSLFKVLESEPAVLMEEMARNSTDRREGMLHFRTSQFCLHAAGDTPSAARLFDAIANLCVPLIVSDNPVLPFTNFLDYRKFALFVSETRALKKGYIVEMLKCRKVQMNLAKMRNELRRVRHVFEWSNVKGAAPHVWNTIARKLPRIRDYIMRKGLASVFNSNV